VKQLGMIGEKALHFGGRLEPGFGSGDFRRFDGGEKAAGADGVDGAMMKMLFGLEEMDIVGGDERNGELAAEKFGFAEETAIAGREMVDFEVEAVGEGGFKRGKEGRYS
jgi:hypothetical protein